MALKTSRRRHRRRGVVTTERPLDTHKDAAHITGIIRPEAKGPSLEEYTENSKQSWVPGKIIRIILILGLLFIVGIALLIHSGFGAAK